MVLNFAQRGRHLAIIEEFPNKFKDLFLWFHEMEYTIHVYNTQESWRRLLLRARDVGFYNVRVSTFNDLDITCEECGEEFKGIVWTAIHAAQDPELKELLLGGELNILMCPKCSHAAYQDHFLLYQDPAAELIAYIYPPAQKPEEEFLSKTMMANYREAQTTYPLKERKDYDPLMVFGLETFVEMMNAEKLRAEQSQIAEAICKEKSIPYFVLRPSEARRLELMRVIPGDKREKTAIQKGIQQLLREDPALDLYAKLVENLSVGPTRLAL
jgi:hypothetical protein